ncbi:hypothetical protein CU044_7325 [Streptomyces sp. L-9-10]|nr:hypothetical protein CU044_7325 [Streptomyces sp. L-9-10]
MVLRDLPRVARRRRLRQELRELPGQRDGDPRHPGARRAHHPRLRRRGQGPPRAGPADRAAPRGTDDARTQPPLRPPGRDRPGRPGLLPLLDQQRRAAQPRARRPLPRAAAARPAPQPLRLVRDQRRQPGLGGRGPGRTDRQARLEQPGVRPRQPAAPRTARSSGRAVRGRSRARAWLRQPSRPYGGTLHRRPVRSLRAALPHRRPCPLDVGRHPGTPRPRRRPGEGTRLPYRARRDRGRSPPAPRDQRRRDRRTGRPPGHRPARRVCRPRRRPLRTRRARTARPHPAESARLHGARRVRADRRASPDLQRQARPPLPAHPRLGRVRRIPRPAHRHGAGARRHLDRGAGYGAGRSRGRFLRPRRAFPARHPGDQPHPERSGDGTDRTSPLRGPEARRPGGHSRRTGGHVRGEHLGARRCRLGERWCRLDAGRC